MTDQVYVLLDTDYDADYCRPIVDRVFATEALAREYVSFDTGEPPEKVDSPQPSTVLNELPPHRRRLTISRVFPTDGRKDRRRQHERWETFWLDRIPYDGELSISIDTKITGGIVLSVSGSDESTVRAAFAENATRVREQAKVVHEAALAKQRRSDAKAARKLAADAAAVLAGCSDEQLVAIRAEIPEGDSWRWSPTMGATSVSIQDIEREQRRRKRHTATAAAGTNTASR